MGTKWDSKGQRHIFPSGLRIQARFSRAVTPSTLDDGKLVGREFAQISQAVRKIGPSSLGRIAFLLSVLVLFTSMIDLFANRLLFRAGPEVLTHMDIPGISAIATAGRISFTFEQLALYVILGSAALLLLRRNRSSFPRLLGLLLLPQLATAALLYAPLGLDWTWGLSTTLVLVTSAEVFGLIIFRAAFQRVLPRRQLVIQSVFLVSLGLSFFFPLYYRVYLLLGAASISSLPFGISMYSAGIYSILATSAAAFVYALTVSSSRFKMTLWNFAKAAIIPTLLVAPILYGLMQSFFMVQIFSLVIAMSTDIVLSFQFVRIVVMFWWFLLTAVFLLMLKGRRSENRFLLQQGIGLVLILSTSFLFNYPNYLLLGTAGVLLLCYPLQPRKSRADCGNKNFSTGNEGEVGMALALDGDSAANS